MNGIDVSTYQGAISWHKVDTDFAMIKATQGRGEGPTTIGLRRFTDSRFVGNINGATAAGIPCGVYHYFTAKNPAEAEEEAEYFLRVIAPYRDKIKLWGAVDVEYAPSLTGLSREALTAAVLRFVELIRAAGYSPMLYTNPDFLKNRFTAGAFDNVDIWLAQWGTARPLGVKRLKIWQYGKGRTEGIGVEVDHNKGYFDLAPSYEIGGTYTIREGDMYSNGRAVPARLVGQTYTIKLVRDKRILLGELNSWVKI